MKNVAQLSVYRPGAGPNLLSDSQFFFYIILPILDMSHVVNVLSRKLGRPLSFSRSGTSWGVAAILWYPSAYFPYMRKSQNSYEGVFWSDEFGGSLSVLPLGGIPRWKQVTISSPVDVQVFLRAIYKA